MLLSLAARGWCGATARGARPALQLQPLHQLRHFSAAPTMAQIKELREQTGAPIVDVKKALVESGCDQSEARLWLRNKGLAKAGKKAGRVTAEGLVAVASDSAAGVATRVAMVELACETDFVARNANFQELADQLAQALLDAPDVDAGASADELAAQLAASEAVATQVALLSATMGENITLRRAGRLAVPEGSDGVVSWYLHGALSPSTGQIAGAVLLSAEGGSTDAASTALIGEYGKRLAMQMVAARPLYVSRADVPEEAVAQEKAQLMQESEGSGKPPEIIERMIDGKLNKWYEGIVMVDQKWMVGAPSADNKTDKKKLDKMTVAQIIGMGSKAAKTEISMGPEVLHFRAGD